MLHKTGIRLLGVARNQANGFPARLLGRRSLRIGVHWYFNADTGPLPNSKLAFFISLLTLNVDCTKHHRTHELQTLD